MLGGLTQREDHEKSFCGFEALEASTAIAFYACTMDPRISESLNWLSWIATEKLLDHNDGQLAKRTQGRCSFSAFRP
ncbi:L-arabinose-binding periplasmic protein [Trichinella spiralis]|uniref:L-arabinose-binding periplasmic protein n=1 Tax=Trichinella spiralis TaxID=6334 RepID=A0ABR3KXK7_TRISP